MMANHKQTGNVAIKPEAERADAPPVEQVEYVVRVLGAVRRGVASFQMLGPLTPASLLRVYLQTLQTFDNVTAAELPPHTVAAWVEGDAQVAFILKATAVPHWGTVLIIGCAAPATLRTIQNEATK